MKYFVEDQFLCHGVVGAFPGCLQHMGSLTPRLSGLSNHDGGVRTGALTTCRGAAKPFTRLISFNSQTTS